MSDESKEAAAAGIKTIDIFNEWVPETRSCREAGIEHFLCVCDAWASCEAADLPAVEHQAVHVAVPFLNDQILHLVHKDPQTARVSTACARELMFAQIQDAKTTSAPPSLQFILTVRAGTTKAMFLVAMACDGGGLHEGGLRGDGGVGNGGRFVPRKSSPCKVDTMDRLSMMSKAEDAVYKAAGAEYGDGKMCVIPSSA